MPPKSRLGSRAEAKTGPVKRICRTIRYYERFHEKKQFLNLFKKGNGRAASFVLSAVSVAASARWYRKTISCALSFLPIDPVNGPERPFSVLWKIRLQLYHKFFWSYTLSRIFLKHGFRYFLYKFFSFSTLFVRRKTVLNFIKAQKNRPFGRLFCGGVAIAALFPFAAEYPCAGR